jgi:hypothetical protein
MIQGASLAFTYVDEAVPQYSTHFDGGCEIRRTFARLTDPQAITS